MKTKTIITTALLLFIFTSVAYLVVKEVCSASQSPSEKTNLLPAAQNRQHSSKVVVYYFHGTARCPTCRKFETFSDQALHSAFAAELADGRLQWQVINVDQPGNEHFIKDYRLYSKSVVVTKVQDNQQLKWKNLDKIWELVRNKEAFTNYIQSEVRQYLETQE